MKRRLAWLLVIVVLLGAVVVMLWPGKRVEIPKAELSFLCYSNGPISPEAIFTVHFPTNYPGSHWKVVEVDRWENGKWKQWNTEGWRPQAVRLMGFSFQQTVGADGRRIDALAGCAIPNTNES